MPNLNNCQFIGNVGNIETKYTADGKAVVNVSLAVNESWKDAQGNKQERTEWVRGVAFGKVAEIMEKYVKKGDPLYFSGKQKTDKYQAPDGTDRYSTSTVIREIQMLGSRPEGQQNQQAHSNQTGGIPMPDQAAPTQDDDFLDSTIPF